MKNRKSYWKSTIVGFAILSVSLLTSCKSVEIKDQEWCGDLGPLGARCFHTISNKKRTLTKEQWDAERYKNLDKVTTTAKAMAENKKALLKLCRLSRRCWYSKQREQIEEFGKNLDSLKPEIVLRPQGVPPGLNPFPAPKMSSPPGDKHP